jgi:uncharacterized protein (DUF169 family)
MSLTPIQLQSLSRLNLAHAPVAISFVSAMPEDVPHVAAALPAGCGYWKHAAEGRSFYTSDADHQNCPVGAYTHNVALPPAKAEELQSMMGTMIELRYLRSEEIAAIPRLPQPMRYAVYTPLNRTQRRPDVVVFRGNARQIMLVSEAARSAGVFGQGMALGRPACAMLPQAMAATAGVASVACIGNRVYTGLGDEEMYFAVPGSEIDATLDELQTILHANEALEQFHRQRAAVLAS